MKMDSFILKGNICWSSSKDKLHMVEQGYLIKEGSKVRGVFKKIPKEWEHLEVREYGDALIIPGMTDLHVHAPQYAFRGTGMDWELLDWLEQNTFPEEARFSDIVYAKKAYEIFVEDLKKSLTTRACIFATIHTPATLELMDLLEKSGMKTMVGKVNMDRNAQQSLLEPSVAESIKETIHWLEKSKGYIRTKPILTPRFVPSCTDELLEQLGRLQHETGIPVQSHLSENRGEIDWVSDLVPEAEFYGDVYRLRGLLGKGIATVMAHCVSSTEEEIEMLLREQVMVAHCPQSNCNLKSGIAPIKKYLRLGLKCGLGTDIGAGASLNLLRCIGDSIQMSKLYSRYVETSEMPLTFEEAFFLATKGGGTFFGDVGSFEDGYDFDVLVLSDQKIRTPRKLTIRQRLERTVYLSEQVELLEKYVDGMKIF
ncbi:MAG: amidohydrolase family protein [Clostridiales bacterium]|nr:amidohydrolase family protein [Clostridiales bacterium]